MLCLAKAYGDEPLKRVVVGTGSKLVYVAQAEVAEADGDAGVGFPADAVFDFDAMLFERLHAAFDSGDRQGLWALWQTAQPLSLDLVDA